MLRGRGITYDTGFMSGGATSGPLNWNEDRVRADLRFIRRELHANAVRITGGDQDRLELAATLAADEGLEVWYSPFPADLSREEMLEFLADSALRAERIRRAGGTVVLVTGAEISLFVRGFVPGDSYHDRLEILTPANPDLPTVLAAIPDALNGFLQEAVQVVRARFGGAVTYASLPFEGVDWDAFDFTGVDMYPNAVDGQFPGLAAGLESLRSHGKPIAVTEFGAPTYAGATAAAGHGHAAVKFEGRTVRALELSRALERDEDEQAGYVGGLIEAFELAGVDTAFVHTFANFHLPAGDTPLSDLDRASYGIVKVTDAGDADHPPTWVPKRSCATVTERYARYEDRAHDAREACGCATSEQMAAGRSS